MPIVAHRTHVAIPCPRVFAFFARPAHTVALAPPTAGLTLVEAPEVVTVGARVIVQARRWGLSRRIVTEVVELVEPERIVEEACEGPFAQWRQVRRFDPRDDGTDLVDEITFAAPAGLLGLTLTEATIRRDLEAAFVWRDERLEEQIRAWHSTRPEGLP